MLPTKKNFNPYLLLQPIPTTHFYLLNSLTLSTTGFSAPPSPPLPPSLHRRWSARQWLPGLPSQIQPEGGRERAAAARRCFFVFLLDFHRRAKQAICPLAKMDDFHRRPYADSPLPRMQKLLLTAWKNTFSSSVI